MNYNMAIRFVTDSASDIEQNMREDVTVVPLHICFGEDEYLDGVTMTHREFYKKLIEVEELPSTSQVAPYEFEEVLKKAREAGEQVIIVTISGKLSGTYQSACIAAQNYKDMAYVVDSENATLAQRTLIEYGLRLKDQGLDIHTIVNLLESKKKEIHLVALLDTLEYLKKGGRISSAAAAIGGLFSIKPVITIQNGEIVVLGKARGSKKGNNLLQEQIALAGGIDFDMPYSLGYTGLDDTLIQKYIEDCEEIWKDSTDKLDVITVGGAIGTHAGPGAIAVAFFSAGC